MRDLRFCMQLRTGIYANGSVGGGTKDSFTESFVFLGEKSLNLRNGCEQSTAVGVRFGILGPTAHHEQYGTLCGRNFRA